jgi:signal transduction histidine kinase
VAGFAVSYGATLSFLILGYPYGPIIQPAALALYSVAAWSTVRVSAAVCLVALAGYLPLELAQGWSPLKTPELLLVTMAWLVMPWVVGAAVRTYRQARDEAAEGERRRQVYEERLRLAKEVHDVVGHGLTVISMQAAVALHVLGDRADGCGEVAEALRAIRTTSRDALEELRATLAALPEDAHGRGPGLDRVPNLVKAVTGGAGLAADLEVAGDRPQVPEPVDLAGYRIVQESLTNVLRHAAARHAVVRIRYGNEAVRLTITDDGRGGTAVAGGGLTGMRERAEALGGAFEAGPRPGGGFEVRAVLPLREGGRRRPHGAGR